jgi:hypothetical protein
MQHTFILAQPYREGSTLYSLSNNREEGTQIIGEYESEDEAAYQLALILQRDTAHAVAKNDAFDKALTALQARK